MPDSIPANVLQLLNGHIASIAQLELLLLLHRNRDRSWTVQEAAKELYIADTMTEPLLESLRASGLAELDESAGTRLYRYAPESDELDHVVGELADLYRQRRLTIINAIHSGPIQNLQKLADAFRIRKKEDD